MTEIECVYSTSDHSLNQHGPLVWHHSNIHCTPPCPHPQLEHSQTRIVLALGFRVAGHHVVHVNFFFGPYRVQRPQTIQNTIGTVQHRMVAGIVHHHVRNLFTIHQPWTHGLRRCLQHRNFQPRQNPRQPNNKGKHHHCQPVHSAIFLVFENSRVDPQTYGAVATKQNKHVAPPQTTNQPAPVAIH